MSTYEYVPSDQDMREDHVQDRANPNAGRRTWDAWLATHDARVRRDAAREVGQYIKRLHPNGLTAKKAVLADIDIAADRMGRGIHANGRDRETP